MTETLAFAVLGVPATKGSLRHVGGGRMVESSKKLPAWRAAITAAAVKAMREHEWETQDGPVALSATVVLERPKSTPLRVLYPHRKNDLDKHLRAILDALTDAKVWTDDGRVVMFRQTRKRYARPGEPTGAVIVVETVGPEHAGESWRD